MVHPVNLHTNTTSERWHLWDVNLKFALNSTLGWFAPRTHTRRNSSDFSNSTERTRHLPETIGSDTPTSPQSGIKSPGSVPLVCTQARQNPVTCGTHQDARKRRVGPSMRAGGVKLRRVCAQVLHFSSSSLLSRLELSDTNVYEP